MSRRHWRSLAPANGLPAYGQLQLSSLAPDLRFLAALATEGADFRFTSVGDEIAERYGRTMAGSYLADQFVGPSQLDIIAAHRACAELGVPVICVGNLVAGGAGKTPAVLALARRLADAGHPPQLLGRGYGGRQRGALAVAPSRPAAGAPGRRRVAPQRWTLRRERSTLPSRQGPRSCGRRG